MADRSIPIVLARKTRDQPVERFRTRDAAEIARGIRAALADWAHGETTLVHLRAARPTLPETLGDRQADICEPLLAIADAAAGPWPRRARAALVELLTDSASDSDSLGVKLLAAIRQVFDEADVSRLSTEDLLDALMLCEDGPWVSWWEREIANGNLRGPGSKLARLLKPYGIFSGTIRRPDGSTLKGYKSEAFADAWGRYLPALEPLSPY